MTTFSQEELSKILESWKDENTYRNGSGKKFLSQSDVGSLVNSPEFFRAPRDKPVTAFIVGSFFHAIVLEPHLESTFEIVDASSRNTKIYKEAVEASGKDQLLLKHEADNVRAMRDKVLGNKVCASLIRAEGNKYEVAGVKKIKGEYWKGKADILCPSQGLIVDLKSSGDISKFKYSARKYYYTAQSYVYSQMFGMDFVFIVCDKTTHQLGIYETSESFLAVGEMAVEQAVANYQKYLGPNKTHDLSQRLVHDTLL